MNAMSFRAPIVQISNQSDCFVLAVNEDNLAAHQTVESKKRNTGCGETFNIKPETESPEFAMDFFHPYLHLCWAHGFYLLTFNSSVAVEDNSIGLYSWVNVRGLPAKEIARVNNVCHLVININPDKSVQLINKVL